jgi:hypothetical protein
MAIPARRSPSAAYFTPATPTSIATSRTPSPAPTGRGWRLDKVTGEGQTDAVIALAMAWSAPSTDPRQ